MSDRDPELGLETDDARFVLAGAAAASARRNRPRWMFVVATAVLLVCVGWLAVALGGVSSARAGLEDNRSQLQIVREISANLAAIRTVAADPSRQRVGDPIPNILQRIDRAGGRHKLDIPIARESADESGGTIERQYIYTISDDSLPALIGWIQDATDVVPGLEVYRISLNPQGDRAWQLDVTFVRYERAS